MTTASPSAVLSFFFFVQEVSLPCVLATLSAKGIRKAQIHCLPPTGGDWNSPAPGKMGSHSLKLIRLYTRGQLLVSKEHLVPSSSCGFGTVDQSHPRFGGRCCLNRMTGRWKQNRVPTSVALPMAPKLPHPHQAPLPRVQNSPVPPPSTGVLSPA